MRRPRRMIAAATVLAGVGAAATVRANWVVVNLHPDGALWSEAYGVHDGQEVGQFSDVGGQWRAALWTGTADSMVDLTPPEGAATAAGTKASTIYSGRQGGQVSLSTGRNHAALWNGAAEPWVDLQPIEEAALDSWVVDMQGDTQVGYWVPMDACGGTTFCVANRACLWHGTADSFVDLNPIGVGTTEAHGVFGSQVVGGNFDAGLAQACMWTDGTAASYVELNPPNSLFSIAQCTDGVHQYGLILDLTVGARVGYWSGSADSFVDMTPDGKFGATIDAIDGNQQVGATGATLTGDPPFRAALWSGTAGSYEDLHTFLPAGYSESEARDIWHDADGTTYVVGWAHNSDLDRNEAVMWVSCPAEINGDGVVDVFDLLDYLTLWFNADAAAELTGDDPASIDVFDLLAYLTSWFGGC